MESLDYGITFVVTYDEDHFVTREHGRVNIRVHHQIGAIADHRVNLTRVSSHCRAPRTRDFVSHTGIAIFAVEGGDSFAHPVDVEFTGQSTRRGQDVIVTRGGIVDQANELGITGGPNAIIRDSTSDERAQVALELFHLIHPRGVRCPVSKRIAHLNEGFTSVGHDRQRPVFDRIEPCRVDSDELRFGGEQCPRPRREVFESCPNSEDDVRVTDHVVRRIGTGHADGSGIVRMTSQQAGLSRNGLNNGNPVLFRKSRKFILG